MYEGCSQDMKGAYAVIYDSGPEDQTIEEYYGWFGSPEEAERVFRDFASGEEIKYRDAHIVQVIRPISKEKEHGQDTD